MQAKLFSTCRFKRIALLFTIGLALVSGAGEAFGGSTNEMKVRAGFVINFAKLTTWPAARFQSRSVPISICVVNAASFKGFLSFMTVGKKVQGRSLDIRHQSRTSSLKGCHILYLGELDSEDMLKIVRGLPANGGVFTVGGQEGLASQGGVANFVRKDDRLRFQISHNAAKRQGLVIDPQLLSLGDQVD